MTPVDRLRDEFTIACYPLGLAFAPDWWVIGDISPNEGWEEILDCKSYFLFRDQYKDIIEPFERLNVIFMRRCAHADGAHPNAWHMPTPCSYGGSISLAIQAAAVLGRTPIILVGCDLDARDHEIALRSAAEMGIEILNATVGGALEVYQRVDFWDLLDGQ